MSETQDRRVALRSARRRAIEVIRPTGDETMLLRALLWPGEAGRDAWRAWHDRIIHPRAEVGGLPEHEKALLPMLHAALRTNEVGAEGTFASYIRAAYVREELRGHAYRRLLLALLDATAADGLRPVLLGGCALSDTVYPDPVSRHSHGLRLLVPEGEVAEVERALPTLGYRRRSWRTPGVRSFWTHRSGLPLEIRTTLLPPPHDRLAAREVHARATPIPQLHAHATTLCPEDALIEIGARAALSRSRLSLRWACDAWLLLDRYGERFDWDRIVRDARRSELSLALSVVLRFLARDLSASIPEEVLASLDKDAEEAGDLAYEMAMLGALSGSHARMWRAIRAIPGVRLRLELLRPLLIPSPAAMRAIQPVGASLPLAYILRPLTYVRNRLAQIGA